MIIGTILQQPGELLDYDVGYTGFFGETQDIISLSQLPTIVCTPAGPQVQIIRSSDVRVKILLNGVTANIDYKLTITMVTENARVKEDELILVGIDF